MIMRLFVLMVVFATFVALVAFGKLLSNAGLGAALTFLALVAVFHAWYFFKNGKFLN